jgi:hypothetical protein
MIKQTNDYENLSYDPLRHEYILPNGARISEDAYKKRLKKDDERTMGKS